MTSHYVVSDVHGYLDDLVDALTAVGLLDAERRWDGGTDELWVLGDLMDRGADGVGVLELVRRLQPEAARAGGRVEVLLGNHEVLALGMRWFGDQPVPSEPARSFARSWEACGGKETDQDRLTDDHVAWLLERPAVAQVGEWLAVHSDSVRYLDLGATVDDVNDAIGDVLSSRDLDRMWSLWVALTAPRFAFVGDAGPGAVDRLVDGLGGSRVVHGHTIVSDLAKKSGQGSGPGPLVCADGRALAIDGGRYEGGPLLVVRLEDHEPD